MRAEEGNETVNDYAIEGEQTLDRIKDSQRARTPLGRVVRRLAKLWRGKPDSSGETPAG